VAAFLIVRLGSLGDIIHALPALAALREAHPGARIDWVVDARHAAILALADGVDRRIIVAGGPRLRAMLAAVAELRRSRYDAAIDFQGLMKSALLARASGAARVIGFGIWHLRERGARPFYTEAHDADARHVIHKNLELVSRLGARAGEPRFPLRVPESGAVPFLRSTLGIASDAPFALVNPGGAWPNKQWPPERFGAIAAELRDRHGLGSAVLWGPGEEAIADAVVAASRGAAVRAPRTTIDDLVALAAAAALMISGDTGPLHIAAALGTPVVGIYGPTDPARNGPFSPDDMCASRFAECRCHHKRRCRAAVWCLGTIDIGEVGNAVEARLANRSRPT
jgi:lipopolysaccharide heptosyltransferase I